MNFDKHLSYDKQFTLKVNDKIPTLIQQRVPLSPLPAAALAPSSEHCS